MRLSCAVWSHKTIQGPYNGCTTEGVSSPCRLVLKGLGGGRCPAFFCRWWCVHFFRSWQNSGRGPGLGRLFVTGSEFIDKRAKRTVNGGKLRRPPPPPSPTDLQKKLRSRASRTAGQWAQTFTYCTHTKQIRWERERDIRPTKRFSFNNRPTSPIIEFPPPEKKKKRKKKEDFKIQFTKTPPHPRGSRTQHPPPQSLAHPSWPSLLASRCWLPSGETRSRSGSGGRSAVWRLGIV